MSERAASSKSVDAYRTISEVADDLGLPQHVLRFWETRFPQIRPLKRAGGRRYYRPADTLLLRAIRQLLYDQGYTIKGVQRLLKEHGVRRLGVDAGSPQADDGEPAPLDAEVMDAEVMDSGAPSRIEPSFGLGFGADEDATTATSDPPDGDPVASLAREPPLGVFPSVPPGVTADELREALALVEECLGIIQAVR